MIKLKKMPVGPFRSNCYLLIPSDRDEGVLIDPGDQAPNILDWVGDTRVSRIILTHGHHDHVGALEPVRQALGAPVGMHPADQEKFGLEADFLLEGGDRVSLGDAHLQVVYLPGHTPGSIGFKLIEGDQFRRALVGDAIFPGGPGHTVSPEDLKMALDTLAGTVFTWDDKITLHPGHGDPTTVGAERQAFDRFYTQPLPPDLYGDVTWR